MARFKKVQPNVHEGKLTYGDGIVDGIVLLALNEIPDVELYTPTTAKKMRNKSIKVLIDRDEVHVDVTVKTHYTQSISDVAFKIQEAVRHNVEAMTEYKIASVNVNFKGVTFEDKQMVRPVETTKEVTDEKLS